MRSVAITFAAWQELVELAKEERDCERMDPESEAGSDAAGLMLQG